ncbi:MAG: ParB/RepB/Spo0J family partition protein [Clostridiales bacterium]|jgi:ParB family chromosome partitioning protein|nr:ParB/RepB/Spo0J family partition protein [Clostridiales bacterium]
MAKKPALGRGLDMIFSDNTPDQPQDSVIKLRLSQVEPKSDQPRQHFDPEALSQLADSIAANGVLQPILVREGQNGLYQIIAGERRWRASKLAGLTEIPALLLEADDLRTAQLALIENLQREDLNPYEEAQAYQTLLAQFDLTQEEVAGRLGKSRSSIANSLRLLDLPECIAVMLQDGRLTAGHCRALLGLRDKDGIEALAQRIVARNLSVRETEAAVKAQNKQRPAPAPKEPGVQVNYVAELEHKVTGLTGRWCRISTKGGRKTISIEFSDETDLETLLETVCGKKITEE